MIKGGHLKIFIKREGGSKSKQKERKEQARERSARPVNDGSSGSINIIVREEAEQSLKMNRKRTWDRKQKEFEVMQVAKQIPRVVSFSLADSEGVEMLHDYALVIEAIIYNFCVQKILVDDKSKVNILHYRVFQSMKIPMSPWLRIKCL